MSVSLSFIQPSLVAKMREEEHNGGEQRNCSTSNENTRNAEVLSFVHHYFMPPLGQRKLPSPPPSGVSDSSRCAYTAEAR